MRKQCDERYFAPTPQRDAMTLVVDAVASRRRPPPDCGDASSRSPTPARSSAPATADASSRRSKGASNRRDARRSTTTTTTTTGGRRDTSRFFGASPCARLASTRDGAIAARRDGAIAAWRRDGGGALRGTTTPPYAGAPPIVAEGTKAAREGTGGGKRRAGRGLLRDVRVRGERWDDVRGDGERGGATATRDGWRCEWWGGAAKRERGRNGGERDV